MEEESEGVAALKPKWNNFLLSCLLPVTFCQALASLATINSVVKDDDLAKTSNKILSLIPTVTSCNDPFDRLSMSIIKLIECSESKLFWTGSSLEGEKSDNNMPFCSFQEAIFEDDSFASSLPKLRVELRKRNILLVAIASDLRESISICECDMKETSRLFLSRTLKDMKLSRDHADEALKYFVDGGTRDLTAKWLDGLELIPLLRKNGLGRFSHRSRNSGS